MQINIWLLHLSEICFGYESELLPAQSSPIEDVENSQKTGLINCFLSIFPGADKMINYSTYPFNRSWSTLCAPWWKLKIRCLWNSFSASCCGCFPRNISELQLLRTCTVPAYSLSISSSVLVFFTNTPFFLMSLSPHYIIVYIFGIKASYSARYWLHH